MLRSFLGDDGVLSRDVEANMWCSVLEPYSLLGTVLEVCLAEADSFDWRASHNQVRWAPIGSEYLRNQEQSLE